jgi:GTPase SAR1 family protein
MIWLTNTSLMRSLSFEELPMFKSRNYNKMFDQNTLIYGPDSCGKKTYVQKWVKHQFKSNHDMWANVEYEIKLDRKMSINLFTRVGYGYTELIISDVGHYERHIVKHIISSICNKLVVFNDGRLKKQVVIIYNIHLLSVKSLIILRNLTYTYTNCIFIMVSSNKTNVHRTIASSGILSIRFIPATFDEIKEHCMRLCLDTHIEFNNDTFQDVFNGSGSHLVNTFSEFSLKMDNIKNPYKELLNSIKLAIMESTHPLKKCRPYFYSCIVNNVCPSRLIKDICKLLINLDILNGYTTTKSKIAICTAKYEHRLIECERTIYHLDAYICQIVSIIREQTLGLFCK